MPALESQWIPRDDNKRTDQISKIFRQGRVAAQSQLIQTLCGDQFASNYNAQLSKFNSRFAFPGAEAVDAFYQDRSKDNDWICPCPGIILRVIKHCYASGTLILLL